jgi:IS605 OrfB family transposase
VLGVDRGLANIATLSSGANYTGKGVARARRRNERLRARLQQRGTRSAKRLLKRRRRKESRFSTDTNHKISFRIVREAQRTGSAIALEDLSGIRSRTRVRKSQRRAYSSWSFYQLGQFIEYKARRAGIPVVFVNPAYTSQHCPCCGHVSRKNRPSRDRFRCRICRLAGPADLIASVNIASLGKVVLVREDAWRREMESELGRGDVTRPDAAVQADQSAAFDRLSVGLVPSGTVELVRPEDLPAALAASSALLGPSR